MVDPPLLLQICGMIWLWIILLLIILLALWLLLAPMQLEIDTRLPGAGLRWFSIGRARIWYDKEWWLSFRVFFYRKTLRLASVRPGPKKIGTGRVKKRSGFSLKKMIRVLRSFRVQEWKLAIDTGDYPLNAQLYPLNFADRFRNHLLVNFNEENFLYVRIRNSPWRVLWAYLR